MKSKKGINTMETKKIKFYDDTLFGIKDETGKVWLAIAHTCKELGFNERRVRQQGEKIRSDKVLSKGVRIFGLPTNGGIQDTFCIEERLVPLWLAKISLTNKMEKDIPNIVEKLETYQLEAADVLHKAFYESEEQKETFHKSMGLDGKIETLEKKLEMTVVQLNNVEETLDIQNEKLNAVMDNMTLTTVQQGKLQRAVKNHVNYLLGGAHSREYKENSKLYFINLWNGLKEYFNCGSRWQHLNPKYFNKAFDYISEWEYIEE